MVLRELINHPILFAAYPSIGDIPISFIRVSGFEAGAAAVFTGKIFEIASDASDERLRNDLLAAIQVAVYQLEISESRD